MVGRPRRKTRTAVGTQTDFFIPTILREPTVMLTRIEEDPKANELLKKSRVVHFAGEKSSLPVITIRDASSLIGPICNGQISQVPSNYSRFAQAITNNEKANSTLHETIDEEVLLGYKPAPRCVKLKEYRDACRAITGNERQLQDVMRGEEILDEPSDINLPDVRIENLTPLIEYRENTKIELDEVYLDISDRSDREENGERAEPPEPEQARNQTNFADFDGLLKEIKINANTVYIHNHFYKN